MAKEIQLPYWTAGLTDLYAIVRSDTATAWNTVGSALEAYVTANRADYDVALTEQGTASRFYVGNMPAVPAGLYSVSVYQRAGGAPAEGDLWVGGGEIDWDGAAVIAVSSVKAKTDSLTFTVAGQLDANVQFVNDVQVVGVGVAGNEWGPAP